MLGHLIRKEILDHLLSLRFLILSGIGALVIWLSLFSGYAYYQDQLKDYQLAQAATEERIRQLMITDRLFHPDRSRAWLEIQSSSYMLHRPPTAMCIFVRGLHPNSGRSILVKGLVPRLKLSPAAAEPILGFFPALDLGLSVQVVFSLFVLLFTYDAVCGEKEAGTLRLMASFSVPKDRLLLGKFFGVLIPTLAAFGLPLMLGMAAVLAMPNVQLADGELLRIGWILIAFGLFLAAFTCAGLFASCLTHRAATSFVLLLTFWVMSVTVMPRLSLIVANRLRPAPSVHEQQAERSLLTRERGVKERRQREQWWRTHPGWSNTPDGREAYYLYYNQIMVENEKLLRQQLARQDETFRNRYAARSDLAVVLARFSPAFALKNATLRLAGVDLDEQQRFESAYQRHQAQYQMWFIETFKNDQLRERHPAKYGTPRWDVSDMPRFTYRRTWPGEEMRWVLLDVGLLALWGLVFCVGAYVAMLRYDLR